ncbi:hypothetical protein V8F06_008666 [Rhypophila decipiens]
MLRVLALGSSTLRSAWLSRRQKLLPDDENASDNMTGDEDRLPKCGIYQYSRDCYCKLKTPISCAWRCNWAGWWQTEDWFAQVCPDTPVTKPVDWSGLPSCARQCLDDNMFQYGCLTQTSNCVCTKGDLFDCHKKCGDGAKWDQISIWLQDTCAISELAATEALKTGTFSLYEEQAAKKGIEEEEKPNPPPLPGRRLFQWDEIFVLCVASVVGFTVFVLWIWDCIARRRRPGRMSKRRMSL